MWRAFLMFILVAIPTRGSEPASGFLLRARAVPLKASYSGPLPELRVENDGEIRLYSCSPTCRWRTVRTLTKSQLISIRRELKQIPRDRKHVKRWYSGAFCRTIPQYQIRFDADAGRIFLGLGDFCLGGGIENSESQELIRFLQSLLPAQ